MVHLQSDTASVGNKVHGDKFSYAVKHLSCHIVYGKHKGVCSLGCSLFCLGGFFPFHHACEGFAKQGVEDCSQGFLLLFIIVVYA